MRELTNHKVNGCNDALSVLVTDEPGSGGANHRYDISGFCWGVNPGACASDKGDTGKVTILFQNGPIKEAGVNGITHEALLAILEDRLAGFQSGLYACAENAAALHHIQEAQRILKERTQVRLLRGVEGTHKV